MRKEIREETGNKEAGLSFGLNLLAFPPKAGNDREGVQIHHF